MTLLAKHPYSFLFAGAGIILLVIVATAKNQSMSPAMQGPLVRVSGGNVLMYPGIAGTGAPTEHGTAPGPTLTPATIAEYTLPAVHTTNSATTSIRNPSPSVDTGLTVNSSLTQSEQLIKEVYALLSGGPSMTPTPKARSEVQQALYEYGNQVGLAVLTFENAHADMAQVLKDWIADRADPSKIAAVNSLAQGLTDAGRSLEGLPQVPETARSANTALARAFADSGDKLRAVASAAGSDTTLVAAMKTYNAAAESFTTSYIGLVDLFSIYDVHFGSSDPGSAFQFQQ